MDPVKKPKHPGGRPTRLLPSRIGTICDRLRMGAGKRASCVSSGVSYETFNRAYQRGKKATSGADREIYLQVEQAEADCEVRYTGVLAKAAGGFDKVITKTSTRTVYEEVETTYPDGRVERRRIPKQITEMDVTRSTEFDWKAAFEWLRRRRSSTWGDRKQVDFRQLSDQQVMRLLNEEADGEDDDPTADDPG